MSNEPQREYWNARAEAWARRADAISTFSDAYGDHALDALGAAPGWRVLDIGCGPGITAIKVARRVSPGGHVVATDISSGMIEEAKRRVAAAGVDNVDFLVADAQTESLGDGFDGAFSRFGVMFFADAVAAFTNIGRALRPGGRLGCAVWGPLEANPWLFVPTMAIASMLDPSFTPPAPDEPGPFSLSDPDRVRRVLGAAGFVDVGIETVETPRLISGGDDHRGIELLIETGPMSDKFDQADADVRQRAIDAVRDAIEPYRTNGDWSVPAQSLTVTAARPSR